MPENMINQYQQFRYSIAKIPDSDECVATVYGFRSLSDSHVVIPDSIQGISVRYFGYAPQWHEYDDSSYDALPIDCETNLLCYPISVTIPETVESISIPDSVTHIAPGALSGNGRSINLIFGRDSSFYFRENCIIKHNEEFELVIGGTGEISFPNTECHIGAGAFSKHTGIKSLQLPGNVRFIKENAFSFSDVAELSFSEGIQQIGDKCFYSCAHLVSVKIPHSVEYIGNDAFACCSKLAEVYIPDGVQSLGSFSAFFQVERNNGKHYGGGLFQNCYSLKSVRLPESLTYCRNDVFYNCTGLECVFFNGTVSQWQSMKFGSIFNLTDTADTPFKDVPVSCVDGIASMKVFYNAE